MLIRHPVSLRWGLRLAIVSALMEMGPAIAVENCLQTPLTNNSCLDPAALTFAGAAVIDQAINPADLAGAAETSAIAYVAPSNPEEIAAIPSTSIVFALQMRSVTAAIDLKQTEYVLETISQVEPVPPADNPWRIEIRPYLEVPLAVDGRIDIDQDDNDDDDDGDDGDDGNEGNLPPIDLPFNAGFDLSNFFLLGGEVEIWYNDIGLYLEGFYVDLGTRVLVGFRDSELVDPNVELSASYTRFAVSLGWHVGTFPLIANATGDHPDAALPAVRLELYGGAEYTRWSVGANLFDAIDLSLDPDWISPIIGANADFLINSRTSLFVRGKVGGFAIGDAPDLIVALQAGLDWEFLPHISFRPSYIYRKTYWDSGENQIDLSTNGIWAGFSLNF
jgi:hypothetical protein